MADVDFTDFAPSGAYKQIDPTGIPSGAPLNTSMPPSTQPPPTVHFDDFIPSVQTQSAPVTPTGPLTWGQVYQGVKDNTHQDWTNFINGVSQTWQHPKQSLQTINDSLYNVPGTVAGAVANQMTPANMTKNGLGGPAVGLASQGANALTSYISSRYGSEDAFKHAIAEHPVQTLMDLSSVLTLGATGAESVGAGALRAATESALAGKGVPGGIAKAVVNAPGAAIAATNPLNVIGLAGKGLSNATRWGVNALTPQRTVLENAAEGKMAQIIAKQKEAIANPIVNGSTPNAGEALGPNPLVGQPGVGPVAVTPTTPGVVGPAPNYIPLWGPVTSSKGAGVPGSIPTPSEALAINNALLLAAPQGQELEQMNALKSAVANPRGDVVAAQPAAVGPAIPEGAHTRVTVEPNAALPPGTIVPHQLVSDPEVPTAPIMTQPEGSPGVVATKWQALVAAADKNHPTEFAEDQSANNAARIAVADSIGQPPLGTTGPTDIPSAEKAMKTQDSINYGKSDPKMSIADATSWNLLHRPLSGSRTDGVLQHAAANMGEGDEAFQVGSYVPAHINAAGVSVPAQYPSYSGRALDAIKKSFDTLAFDQPSQLLAGIDKSDALKIADTRKQFLNWVGQSQNNPEYIQALNDHAIAANQIDRLKLGQYYKSILQTPLSDSYQMEQRAHAFASALDNPINDALGNSTLARATGQQRVMHVNDVLQPHEVQGLQNMKADMLREALARAQAGKATPVFGDMLNNAASDGANIPHIPFVPTQFTNALNMATRLLTGGADQRVAGRLGPALRTPETALPLLQNALAQKNLLDVLGAGARAAGRIGNLPNRLPITYNITNQQRNALNNQTP